MRSPRERLGVNPEALEQRLEQETHRNRSKGRRDDSRQGEDSMRNQGAGMMGLLLFLSCLMSGCVVFALGAGAAGGYAISRDEIEGFTDKNYGQVWQSGREVLQGQGLLTLEDKTHGRIQAMIGDSKVRFEAIQVTPKSIRMRVQARKFHNMFPDMELAQRIYTLIVNELK